MKDTSPTALTDGHEPLSSYDERTGGVAGALILGSIGYKEAGPAGALACGLVGWAGGEAFVDKS